MGIAFDIIVIGGGHAGIEAAWAAARRGAEVALVTMKADAIGRLSCNPAFGGLGKGQMVREIDALGGLMGLAADRAGIQFRMLNRSKGPAVWAPRAQAERNGYPKIVQELLSQSPRIQIIEGAVERILARDVPGPAERPGDSAAAERPHGDMVDATRHGPRKRVTGVELSDGRRLGAQAVVVTTGTFLRALMHCGADQTHGGRIGEAAALGLSDSLRTLGLELGRLKTGTPPRVHRDSIDYSRCDLQAGDDPPTPFSLMTDAISQPQVTCWVTWTNAVAHEHIRANLHRAPMYSGQIQSRGPRYCPSIEDKVVRFAEKDRHQVFLEPEGLSDERIYCNGISTSLPRDVQDAVVLEIAGLEKARILQYGYAVEYDFVPTNQTRLSLEAKLVAGLFLAGQINGTSGYEEAGAQGLVAGINAVQFLRGEEPIVLRRDEAYIGVMIDDLVTRPPAEPYRMFTSRAEYRLLLRADNADQRLTPLGRRLGTVDNERWDRFTRKVQAVAAIRELAARGAVDGVPLAAWMRRPDADAATLAEALARNGTGLHCVDALEQALIDAKYSGYVDRQARQIERFRRLESLPIPDPIDYVTVPGLRAEARERLLGVAPRTLGQAARISGITPADVTVLWIYITGRQRARL
ncbi:MAG: tRNA uridine-5-carboxymethylaminomethyl(34) synthesis enzyme MnmG [Planctomycetes bacterium]|nr:tRNA uridine-5-carboxymethylaminomethyl(34) synthesis enzyme MnmG [Planctomycetota bacterium]